MAKVLRTVKEAWEWYRANVMPLDAGEVQLRETEQAFYAGASMVFFGLMLACSDNEEPTVEELALLDRIEGELMEFGAKMDALHLDEIRRRKRER